MLLPAAINTRTGVAFARSNGLWRGAFFDRFGTLLPESLVRRYGYGPNADVDAELFGPSIFWDCKRKAHRIDRFSDMHVPDLSEDPVCVLGFLDHQFGHFILESLSRSWAVPHALDKGWKILIWRDRDARTFQQSALSLLGITSDMLVEIGGPVRFKEVHFPTAGYHLVGSGSTLLREGWARIRRSALETGTVESVGERVYLSRRANQNRPLLNEDEVEDCFRELGFDIVRPEEYTFEDQVRIIAKAEKIASCFGSQSHLSVFSGKHARKLVICHANFIAPDESIISTLSGGRISYHIERHPELSSRDYMKAAWRVDVKNAKPFFRSWALD